MAVAGLAMAHPSFANFLSFTSNKTDQPVLKDVASVGAWKASGFTAREQWLIFDKQGKVQGFYLPYGSPTLNVLNGAGQSKLVEILKGLQ